MSITDGAFTFSLILSSFLFNRIITLVTLSLTCLVFCDVMIVNFVFCGKRSCKTSQQSEPSTSI